MLTTNSSVSILNAFKYIVLIGSLSVTCRINGNIHENGTETNCLEFPSHLFAVVSKSASVLRHVHNITDIPISESGVRTNCNQSRVCCEDIKHASTGSARLQKW